MRSINAILISIFAILFMVNISSASFTVAHLNATVTLNNSNNGEVSQVLTVYISNYSISEYNDYRVTYNNTLEKWESVIGPELSQNILSKTSGVYNFKLLPGPVYNQTFTGGYANIYVSYDVHNLVSSKRIAPKVIEYKFNDSDFNFDYSLGEDYLYPNTTFTIIIPKNSKIISIYPTPNYPIVSSSDYSNDTKFTWSNQILLNGFVLKYDVNEDLQYEINLFESSLYSKFGGFLYFLAIIIIIVVIIYLYLGSKRW